ncbi:MAG: hypothetical protein ACRDQW_13995, partial [Haloechinothrix sp.]
SKVVDEARRWIVRDLQVLRAGRYRSLNRVVARPGQTLRLRVVLRERTSSGRSQTIYRHFRVTVPKGVGGRGELTVASAADSGGGFDDECFFFGECGGGSNAKSFAGLVRQLDSAPRNDILRVDLELFRSDGRQYRRHRKTRLNHVIEGFDAIRLRVRR